MKGPFSIVRGLVRLLKRRPNRVTDECLRHHLREEIAQGVDNQVCWPSQAGKGQLNERGKGKCPGRSA